MTGLSLPNLSKIYESVLSNSTIKLGFASKIIPKIKIRLTICFMRTEFLCISVLRVASGLRVKLASCKSALNPAVVFSTGRSKAFVLVLFLLFVALSVFFFFFFFFLYVL